MGEWYFDISSRSGVHKCHCYMINSNSLVYVVVIILAPSTIHWLSVSQLNEVNFKSWSQKKRKDQEHKFAMDFGSGHGPSEIVWSFQEPDTVCFVTTCFFRLCPFHMWVWQKGGPSDQPKYQPKLFFINSLTFLILSSSVRDSQKINCVPWGK